MVLNYIPNRERRHIDMVDERKIAQAANWLRGARSIVVFSGAGVSKESGVPTFRDAQTGLWANYDPQRLATPEGFVADPKLVWDWYEERRRALTSVAPNAGHFAIAALERIIPQVVVVTQNIDGLHQRAGSTDVIPLHGDISRHKCFANCQGDPTIVDIATLEWDYAGGDHPRVRTVAHGSAPMSSGLARHYRSWISPGRSTAPNTPRYYWQSAHRAR